MNDILPQIVSSPIWHARLLNTLSYMENAGARKISACEDAVFTELMQLKHAAEEHRHAYYLKKQIQKLAVSGFDNYADEYLLAATASKQYLHRLDVQVCKYLIQTFGLQGQELKNAAYLFVTYAIEVRADELYPIYQMELTKQESKVMVKSIILEEVGHLEEMVSALKKFHPEWEVYAKQVLKLEQVLFVDWMRAITEHLEADTKKNALFSQ